MVIANPTSFCLHGIWLPWQTMALKVLKLPGGQDGLRAPYLMPPDDEVQRFAAGLLQLDPIVAIPSGLY